MTSVGPHGSLGAVHSFFVNGETEAQVGQSSLSTSEGDSDGIQRQRYLTTRIFLLLRTSFH